MGNVMNTNVKDDDLDELDETQDADNKVKFTKIKALIYVIPVLIVIGLVVAFLSVTNQKFEEKKPESSYSVIEQSTNGINSVIILYDLPELSINLKKQPGQSLKTLKTKINLELSSVNDVQIIEKFTPKILDSVIAHVVELTEDEINGITNLYWLKEELLNRITLIVTPAAVTNLSFRTFEIQTQDMQSQN